MLPLFIISAVTCYTVAGICLIYLIHTNQALSQRLLLAISTTAIAAHGISSFYTIYMVNLGLNLNVLNMGLLILFMVNCLTLLSSLQKPLHGLFILLFPVSIIYLLIFLSFGSALTRETNLNTSFILSIHILLSVIAYSLLTIVTLQALLIHWQSQQLKQHKFNTLMNLLPPLQSMEAHMFELLLAGVVLLSFSIILGFTAVDHFFAQHLAHKTFLSLFAWGLFTFLLWGRYRFGWRGNQATRWVLSGSSLLMLAYFGSNFVLQIIL